jgi:hypothetical protein
LRDPLSSAVKRELQSRGQKSASLTMDERLHEAQRLGFFLVQEGHETEVRAYQQWCMSTGVPSVCVAMGAQTATVAISYGGVPVSATFLLDLLQQLTERWPAHTPQLLPPASLVLVDIPRAIVLTVMPELVGLLRLRVTLTPAREEQASPAFAT